MIKITKIRDEYVFPIFKNGYTSIRNHADQNRCRWFINEQCRRADTITVIIREPRQRYISGVHTVVELLRRKHKNINHETVVTLIENYNFSNEHFQPQWAWMLRLKEYFSGNIKLEGMVHLDHLTGLHDGPFIPEMTNAQRKILEAMTPPDLSNDYKLYRQIGTTGSIADVLS